MAGGLQLQIQAGGAVGYLPAHRVRPGLFDIFRREPHGVTLIGFSGNRTRCLRLLPAVAICRAEKPGKQAVSSNIMNTYSPRDYFVTAQDGLRLHVREWGPRTSAAMPVVCLPGPARTPTDFEALAQPLATNGQTRR